MAGDVGRAGADREWDELAAGLNEYGVLHVRPAAIPPGRAPRGRELIRRLQVADAVRLREALIPLLLTHPELDGEARHAIADLPDPAARRARLRYVAAGALQRMWRTRLLEALGPHRLIEPAYLDELGLPPLDDDFGRATLLALSNLEQAEHGHDAWAGYTSLMDLLLGELRSPAWGRPLASAG
ncbi:MAG TPA: hypothetical protein VG370_18885 [Chloroflexota bacterium]|jgi:hypothetical protein|nr:hypothetical protein [Chloroflexota bacterium]